MTAVAFLLTSALSYGQSIAAYNFDSGSAASIDSQPDSTASNFDVSSIAATISSGTGTVFIAASDTTNSEANAISGNDYYSFTITPDSGFEFDLTELDFGTEFSSTDADVTGLEASYVVRSSVDGFASNIGSTFIEDFESTSTLSFTNRTVSLSATDFQNVASAIEFRIYTYDNSGAATRLSRVDNVILTGTVNAIPEVNSFSALLGFAAVMAVLGLRRRR